MEANPPVFLNAIVERGGLPSISEEDHADCLSEVVEL